MAAQIYKRYQHADISNASFLCEISVQGFPLAVPGQEPCTFPVVVGTSCWHGLPLSPFTPHVIHASTAAAGGISTAMLIPGNYKKAVRFVHTGLTRFTKTQETGYKQAECICIDRVISEVDDEDDRYTVLHIIHYCH